MKKGTKQPSSGKQFKVSDITLTQVSIEEFTLLKPPKEDLDNGDIQLEIKAERSSSSDMSRYMVQFEIRLIKEPNSDGDKVVHMYARIQHVFEIKNLKDFIVNEDEQFFVDQQLDLTVLSIAYSTCRGIILTKTAGVIETGVLLPIADPLKFV